jgi:DNA-binding MarR family transcriptional regulator
MQAGRQGKDFVDRMLDEIHAQTPGVDTRPMAAISRILRAAMFFQAAMNRIAGRAGVTYRELLLLAALRRAAPSFCLNPGQLLKECFAPSSTMTRQLDHLSSLGLVERKPDPNDRRGVLVRLTGRGKRLIDSTLTLGVLSDERELQAIYKLSPEQIETLNRTLHELLLVLEAEEAGQFVGMLFVKGQSPLAAK